MQWIYLSPHFDDVTLSCGGLAWEQARHGNRVEFWTICAGDVPDAPLSPFAQSLHDRWQTSLDVVKDRRLEDMLASQRLGVAYRYFSWPDCIYRYNPETGQPVIGGEEDLFSATPEPTIIRDLAELLKRTVPKEAHLVSPVALGNHVDHWLTRFAAESSGLRLFYYPDYPYILQSSEFNEQVEQNGQGRLRIKSMITDESESEAGKGSMPKWLRLPAAISQEGLAMWQSAISAYRSQISTFWGGLSEMELAIRNYWAGGGGRLLQKIDNDL